jgi:hypothetical protein
MGKMKEMAAGQDKELIKILKSRFESHMHRHEDIAWGDIQARIENTLRWNSPNFNMLICE